MMKRPLGLWILLSAGVLWLNTQDVLGARATSTTTTTTSTTETNLSEESEAETEAVDGATNSTKPVLTGKPQIDYIWDPNLPKELNGYNLSDYPFYERVPANITFKCDGLHDGFYASVLHKCQVYHHCLFGTRFDFLCANYTAFDQKTFICHFASEVDCNNSKKFWHRNDDLYKAATTTTNKPLVIATTPLSPTVLSTPVVPSGPGTGQWRGVARPYRRRRPYYEYYEDYYDDFYYDDRPRSRGRKRPRPRPRPAYEDDYEDDYEDEVYERRGSGGRRNENRRPYNRRPNSNRGRNKDRPRYDYDDEYYGFEDEEDTNSRRRKPTDKNKKSSSRRRPAEKSSDEIDTKQKPKSETRTIIKPVSGTIYDRPRIAPKIKLPVPKNEANKYAYKPITKTEVLHKKEDDYDSYAEDVKPKTSNDKNRQRQNNPEIKPKVPDKKEDEKLLDDDEYYYEYYDDDSPSKERDTVQKETAFSSKREKEKPKDRDIKTSSSTTTSTTTTTIATPLVNTETPTELYQPVVIRLVKRPLLPNKGTSTRPAGSRATQSVDSTTPLESKYENDFRSMTTIKAPEKEEYAMDSIRNYMHKDYTDQQLKTPYKNPLEINVEEYDVTLNEALNPTLPNLPVRGYPTGFDVPSDYSYSNYQKSNRFTSDQTGATATTNYLIKNKPPRYDNVYHHCLFGIRYDFLCANYTAFDQTLFNCNFVSNVDCENSKKFWSRNDELYKTQSTTPPPIVYSFYTQSPLLNTAQGSLIRRVPQRRIPVLINPASIPAEGSIQQAPSIVAQTDNAPVEVPSGLPPPLAVEIPLEPRRRVRPSMRVRPYYDYYEDYEEPPRYVRNRQRPRPLYDDDDYEYYDDRVYRRNEGRRRRPYDRPIRRYKGRRDRYEDEDYEDYAEEEDIDKKKINRSGSSAGNTRYTSKRKPSRTSQTAVKSNRRPVADEEDEEDDKRPRNDPIRNRNSNRRPNYEYEDDQLEDINEKTNKKGSSSEISVDETKTSIKPNGGNIFDRPRVAPKINHPVLKNVPDKSSYKSMASKPTAKDEVDDEQESEDSPNAEVTTIRGNFKRAFMSRRPIEGKTVRSSTKKPSTTSETEEGEEEIQESKANTRQTTLKKKIPLSKESVEIPESTKKERRSENQDRQRGATRYNNIFKTRHSLSTPEARNLDDNGDYFAEIDESINEA